MFISKFIFLLVLLLASFLGTSQNYKDSILNNTDALLLEKYQIDSLNIKTIEFIEYLTEEEKKSPEINTLIYSKSFEYNFKKGKLQEISWSYTGVDSLGTNHFKTKTVGFKPYSFIFEDSYIYNSSGNLERIDQNTPHKKIKGLYIYKRVKLADIKINRIPAKSFLLDKFNDIYEVVIELDNDIFLQFEID